MDFPITPINTYQAAISNIFLGEIEATSISSALHFFNKKLDPRITGFEIYRNGKLCYSYTRNDDQLVKLKDITMI